MSLVITKQLSPIWIVIDKDLDSRYVVKCEFHFEDKRKDIIAILYLNNNFRFSGWDYIVAAKKIYTLSNSIDHKILLNKPINHNDVVIKE